LNFDEYIVITFRIGVLTDLFWYLEKKLYHFIESERMCSHITCEACVQKIGIVLLKISEQEYKY
jgi:hypothetical protein